MNNEYKRIQESLASVREKTDFKPDVALILGSGLGAFAEQIKVVEIIPYKDIKHFAIPTVEGHSGNLVFGYIGNVPVAVMQGRVHYYEGNPMNDVVLPVRLMHMLGAETLFLTNAAGGLNPEFSAGDFMLITDQIANFVPSPLIGPNIAEFGIRFPDMSAVYSKRLQRVIHEAATKLSVPLREGVYVQLTGPNFETPAEVKMCRIIGGDAVGMSTACEAIAAHHCGMEVCGVSLVTNMGSGISETPLTHEEVTETADKQEHVFRKLLLESISHMGK